MAAYAVFYPAAALYAALAVPAFAFGLMPPGAHAHEMLFGFALGVVAGNQLGALSRHRVSTLFLLWLAARVAFLALPASTLSVALNIAFPSALAWHAAPRLFGTAKKLRNQALPATLTALCAAAVYWELARAPVELVVMLFGLLMLFMGGRIVAPAIAGGLHRQGVPLDARVQPRVEGALIAMGALACGALLIRQFEIAGVLAIACGVVAAVRLARWRLWKLSGRADLWCLAAGYGWLALGLVVFGASLVADRLQTTALHVITIGALGSLTLNVMALSWLLKARRYPSCVGAIAAATALIAAATLARVSGLLVPAALCWAAAYAVLLGIFSRASRARS